jgi:hypothetical protein
MYESRTMKPIEIALRKGGKGRKERRGVNLIMI